MTLLVTGSVIIFISIDAVDDMLGSGRWAGCPIELIGILGTIVGGMYAPDVVRALRKGRNGNGTKEVPG